MTRGAELPGRPPPRGPATEMLSDPDVAGNVAALLADRDLAALSGTGRELHRVYGEVLDERLTVRSLTSATVASGLQLRQRLGQPEAAGSRANTVAALPERLRAEPLVALGGQVLGLPESDRAQAIQDFLAHARSAGTHRVMDSLTHAARDGEEGLRNREALLVAPGGAAHQAVQGGESIEAVTRRLGIGGHEAISALNQAAMPAALNAVARGEGALSVARRTGISSDDHIVALRNQAINTLPPRLLWRARQFDRQWIDPELDDTTPQLAQAVNQASAIHAARRGQALGEVARQYRLDPLDARVLEVSSAALLGSGDDPPRQGVAAAVRELGITRPDLITRIERRMIDGAGAAMLRGGSTPDAVAEQLGIAMPEHLALLQRMAEEQNADAIGRGN